MGHRRTLFIICVITAILALACSKSGGDTATPDPHITDFSDSTTPVVNLLNPSDSQVYRSGDTIKVLGRVTDNGLYRGSIRITNDANSAVVKEQLYEIHGYQVYDFQLDYKVIVVAVANYTVTVQFEDHGQNAGIKTARVKINP